MNWTGEYQKGRVGDAGSTVVSRPRNPRPANAPTPRASCLRPRVTPCRHSHIDKGERAGRGLARSRGLTRLTFEENDGRGKDRPVLVVAREAGGRTLLAVQLSSKRHDNDREWVPIGTGPWDGAGRESWVDVDRVLRVHEDGMRREACALDRGRFQLVVNRLRERYGWR
ncbi:type II toxin-antitoxin system PemK/MazF family toxin [Streptomyces sp. NPDC127051]|uniref:type II toxin-antitoxin system PemK/MazF family toxin n=1 Tax=Streptomyces sp. NPDC127051 TaxID=3347119 RepID=UPI003656A835